MFAVLAPIRVSVLAELPTRIWMLAKPPVPVAVEDCRFTVMAAPWLPE